MNSNEVLQLIKERKSTRAFDGTRAIEPEILHSILEAAAYAPTGHNMQNFQIVAVDDKPVLAKLCEIETSFTPEFVQWNLQELSFSEEELKKKKTGMLADSFPPVWFTPEAREGKLKPEQLKGKLGGMLANVPLLMLILFDPERGGVNPSGESNDIMSLGFMLENVWLMANAQGIGVRIVSSVAAEPAASEIKKIISIPEALNIAIGCCLGYPSGDITDGIRVHRDVEDFTFFNHYRGVSSK